MLLVKEFVDRKLDGFPSMFYKSIPTVCPDCGASMEMNESLTKLSCSNLRCSSKVVQRLDALIKALGVKNFGEARITSFVKDWGVDNPLFIFAFKSICDGKPLALSISMDVTNNIIEQVEAKKSMTLAEYVRLANIPYIQNSASHIFGDYDDLDEAYEDILNGGPAFIQSKLGLNDVSTRVLLVYDSLIKFKEDLSEGIGFVNIIPVHKEESIFLRAVVSDEVGSGFKTKADFYNTCNNLAPDKLHIEFLSSVNKNIDYLIWAGADGSPARYTNKVQKVEKYNMQYAVKKDEGKLKEGDHWIGIVTANDFIKAIKEKAGIS